MSWVSRLGKQFRADYGYFRRPSLGIARDQGVPDRRTHRNDLVKLAYMYDRNQKCGSRAYDGCVCDRLKEFRRCEKLVAIKTSRSGRGKMDVDIEEAKRWVSSGALSQVMRQ